jgi:hypothetical protein
VLQPNSSGITDVVPVQELTMVIPTPDLDGPGRRLAATLCPPRVALTTDGPWPASELSLTEHWMVLS